ncbi:sialate O-acetylesterase [Roseibacillus persicicus]|uniref:Sialate O-acetylesterase domain-containing protein n=2 Tax=Roseibacillus persicicus TaxID=454148 RepID=A0A918TND8_9BACT|nr:hypothetical protein GCM10007100_18570 [Roseibacillus persicicus]
MNPTLPNKLIDLKDILSSAPHFQVLAMILALSAPFTPAAADVIISGSAPNSEILDSVSGGLINTSLFPLTNTAPAPITGNANHARGQLFSLGEGTGTAFEISAITFQKDVAATFANDSLTLRIFEGTSAQWTSGEGHLATDSTFYKGTSVTPLYTEVFTLDGLIGDNQFITLELSTPLLVNENSDFGFFLTYDPSSGTSPDRLQHLEGNSGGRLSITTSGHSNSSRGMNYFIQGTPASAGNVLFLDNPVVSNVTTAAATLGATISGGSGITEHGTSLWENGGSLGDLPTTLGAVSNTPTTVSDSRSGLSPATVYNFAAYATNSTEGTVYSPAASFLTEPNPASNLTIEAADSSTISVSWTDEVSSSGALVIISEGSAPGLPIDGTNYTADLDFGSGYSVGGGYVAHSGLYPGVPISINVPGGEYFISVYSYADASVQPRNYNTSNPAPTASILVEPPLQLGSPFQDRMILQRDKAVKVWGKGEPLTSVSVSVDSSTVTGTVDGQGDWVVELPAHPAGGPFSLTVTNGSDSETISDILYGDVWLCFGQSNMVYTLNQMADWKTTYINEIAGNDEIRCLKATQDASLTEADFQDSAWLANSTASSWTAIGSVFASQLHAATDAPVGIIWAAYGSSSIEGWLPLEQAEELPHFEGMLGLYQSLSEYNAGTPVATRATNLGYSSNEDAINGILSSGWTRGNNDADIFIRTRPNILYNQMIHPLVNFGISGFIWYQGEANAGEINNIAQYRETFPRLVKEYRERFDQGSIPFLGVQLPSFRQEQWPWFREVQGDTLDELENAFYSVSIDTGLLNNIHPTDKEPIGARLALLARKYALGEAIEAHGPTYDSMSVDGNIVTINFTNADGLGTGGRVGPAAFEIAGSDQVFYPTTSSSVSGNSVLIRSDSVPNPVAVRYAWAPYLADTVNLINSSDLPAAPFRTDSWDLPGLSAWAPTANSDAYSVARDSVLTVPPSGVLANDFDLNLDTLATNLVTPPAHGSLSILPDGSFTYTPEAGFAGTDSFAYEATESTGSLTSNLANVSITVEGEPTGYYLWKNEILWGPSDDQSFEGDPDGDLVVNFLEFALGMNPLQQDPSGLPSLSYDEAGAVYDFNNIRPGVSYEILLSTDLITWSDPPFAILTSESATPVILTPGEEANGKLFIRLKVYE